MKERLYAFVAVNSSTLGIMALIVAALIMLTGCHTVAGVGTDITKSAQWTQEKISGGSK
jgi:predicted small secreted protein